MLNFVSISKKSRILILLASVNLEFLFFYSFISRLLYSIKINICRIPGLRELSYEFLAFKFFLILPIFIIYFIL